MTLEIYILDGNLTHEGQKFYLPTICTYYFPGIIKFPSEDSHEKAWFIVLN